MLIGQVNELREAYMELGALQDQQKSQKFAAANVKFGEALGTLLAVEVEEEEEEEEEEED